MSDHAQFAVGPVSLGEMFHRASQHWKRIVLLGSIVLLLGLLAFVLVVTATIASVLMIGAFMILTGVFDIMLGLAMPARSRLFLWVAAGVVYILAGGIAIARPMLAASVFTLMLGAGFLATGVLRTVLGFQRVPDGGSRGLVIASGIVTIILGLIILLGWPENSIFVLGTLLAVDLIIWGIGWISFGLALRNWTRRGN
jgi:uncharacterized membrane protein HdeD (DUF308 family)